MPAVCLGNQTSDSVATNCFKMNWKIHWRVMCIDADVSHLLCRNSRVRGCLFWISKLVNDWEATRFPLAEKSYIAIWDASIGETFSIKYSLARLNFTLRHMDVTCEAYSHFRNTLNDLESLQDRGIKYTAEPIKLDFCQALIYERIEQLVSGVHYGKCNVLA